MADVIQIFTALACAAISLIFAILAGQQDIAENGAWSLIFSLVIGLASVLLIIGATC